MPKKKTVSKKTTVKKISFKSPSKKELNFFLILLCGFVIVAAFLIRFLSPEDTWVCQQGQWVKHGNPNVEQPTSKCLN
jgi:cytoskeletal protein RodZ